MAIQETGTQDWKKKALQVKDTPRASRILAKALYKELKNIGFSRNEILAVSSEIVGLVGSEMKQLRETVQ